MFYRFFRDSGAAVVSSQVPADSVKKSRPPGRPSDVFSPPDSCPLTENELRQMDQLLQSFDDAARSDQSACDNLEREQPRVVALSADRCSRLKASIVSNVNDLKIVFQCLQMGGGEAGDYEKLKAAYESKVGELRRQADSARRRFDSKLDKETNRLRTHFQQLEKRMRVALEKWGRERRDDNTKLILEYLDGGKIESACSAFRTRLTGQSKTNVNAIVKSAVRKELGTNISTAIIIRFVEALTDDAEAMAHGAIQLFRQLEMKQALDGPTARALHGAVGNIIRRCRALEGTDFETLKLILDQGTVARLIHVFNKLEFLIEHVQ